MLHFTLWSTFNYSDQKFSWCKLLDKEFLGFQPSNDICLPQCFDDWLSSPTSLDEVEFGTGIVTYTPCNGGLQMCSSWIIPEGNIVREGKSPDMRQVVAMNPWDSREGIPNLANPYHLQTRTNQSSSHQVYCFRIYKWPHL